MPAPADAPVGPREMSTNFTIRRAIASDAQDIAVMVGELLAEIMNATGVQAFKFDLGETASRLQDFLHREKYFVFVARGGSGNPAGFIALYESYALYAEGAFGTIPELYVRPEYRTNGLGLRLVSQAKSFGASRCWTRLEVTTPPLPQFDRTLAFYEREGFAISGGRKLKVSL
jgi:ribosomal protein S18 acetylase RimI-like enzyme